MGTTVYAHPDAKAEIDCTDLNGPPYISERFRGTRNRYQLTIGDVVLYLSDDQLGTLVFKIMAARSDGTEGMTHTVSEQRQGERRKFDWHRPGPSDLPFEVEPSLLERRDGKDRRGEPGSFSKTQQMRELLAWQDQARKGVL